MFNSSGIEVRAVAVCDTASLVVRGGLFRLR
jgi:hypothetical protein